MTEYDDPYGNGTLVPDDRWGRANDELHGHCPKCRRYVVMPWDGPPPDLSDTTTVDRIVALLMPKLIEECPNHER